MINLKLIKDWYDTNINTLAWQRIGLELFEELSNVGLDFDQIDNPKATDEISVETFEIINAKTLEVYNLKIERKKVEV